MGKGDSNFFPLAEVTGVSGTGTDLTIKMKLKPGKDLNQGDHIKIGGLEISSVSGIMVGSSKVTEVPRGEEFTVLTKTSDIVPVIGDPVSRYFEAPIPQKERTSRKTASFVSRDV